MKRVLSFVLTVVLAVGLLVVPVAAAGPKYKVKSVVESVGGTVQFEYKYTYNNKNQVSKLEVISGEGADTQVFEYTYDKKGNPERVLLYYKDSGSGTTYDFYSYTYYNGYDSKSRLISQTMDCHKLEHRNDSIEGAELRVREETVYEYDSSGKLSYKMIFERTSASSVVTEYTYTYGSGAWTEVEKSVTKGNGRAEKEYLCLGRWNGPMILTVDSDGMYVMSYDNLPFTEMQLGDAVVYIDGKNRLSKLEIPGIYSSVMKITYR